MNDLTLNGIPYEVPDELIPALDKLLTGLKKDLEDRTYGFYLRLWKKHKDVIEAYQSKLLDKRMSLDPSEDLERLCKIMEYIDEFEGIPTLEDIERVIKEHKETDSEGEES